MSTVPNDGQVDEVKRGGKSQRSTLGDRMADFVPEIVDEEEEDQDEEDES